MVSATSWVAAKSARASRSIASMDTFSRPGSRAVPALPGATKTRSASGERAAFQARACSRPPLPIIRMFILLFSLVAEVPHTGEDHGNAMLVSCVDHFLVSHGTAGLDNGRDTRCGSRINTIPEWEEGVRGHDRARDFQVFIRRLDAGNFRAVHPAHLTGTDADGATRAGVHNGVGFDIFGHFTGEQHVIELVFGGLALSDHLDVIHGHHAQVAILYQQATGHPLVIQ